MGRVAKILASLTVSANSPDQNLHGELTGRGVLTIHFNSAGIDDYASGPQLAAQVSKLISRLLYAKREAEYSKVHALSNLTSDDAPHWNTAVESYRKRRDEINAVGESASGAVTISSVGMFDAHVTIASKSFAELNSSAFLFEVRSAFADLRTDWAEALQSVRAEALQSVRIER